MARAWAQAQANEMLGCAASTLPSVRKLTVLTVSPAANKISDVLATKVNRKRKAISYHSRERKASRREECRFMRVSGSFSVQRGSKPPPGSVPHYHRAATTLFPDENGSPA